MYKHFFLVSLSNPCFFLFSHYVCQFSFFLRPYTLSLFLSLYFSLLSACVCVCISLFLSFLLYFIFFSDFFFFFLLLFNLSVLHSLSFFFLYLSICPFPSFSLSFSPFFYLSLVISRNSKILIFFTSPFLKLI